MPAQSVGVLDLEILGITHGLGHIKVEIDHRCELSAAVLWQTSSLVDIDSRQNL